MEHDALELTTEQAALLDRVKGVAVVEIVGEDRLQGVTVGEIVGEAIHMVEVGEPIHMVGAYAKLVSRRAGVPQLSDEQIAALTEVADERGITVPAALDEAIRAYTAASHEARVAEAFAWVLDEHHDILLKLGQ